MKAKPSTTELLSQEKSVSLKMDETLIYAYSVTLFGRFLLSEGVVDERFVEQESLYMDQYSLALRP